VRNYGRKRLELVTGSKTNPVAADSLIARLCRLSIDDMLYTACPDLASTDEVTIDALLVSRRHVAVVFHFPGVSLSDQGFWNQVEEAQNSIYFAVTQKLSDNKDLRKGRDLAIRPAIASYLPQEAALQKHNDVVVVGYAQIPTSSGF
jgi:hypothetical protein